MKYTLSFRLAGVPFASLLLVSGSYAAEIGPLAVQRRHLLEDCSVTVVSLEYDGGSLSKHRWDTGKVQGGTCVFGKPIFTQKTSLLSIEYNGQLYRVSLEHDGDDENRLLVVRKAQQEEISIKLPETCDVEEMKVGVIDGKPMLITHELESDDSGERIERSFLRMRNLDTLEQLSQQCSIDPPDQQIFLSELEEGYIALYSIRQDQTPKVHLLNLSGNSIRTLGEKPWVISGVLSSLLVLKNNGLQCLALGGVDDTAVGYGIQLLDNQGKWVENAKGTTSTLNDLKPITATSRVPSDPLLLACVSANQLQLLRVSELGSISVESCVDPISLPFTPHIPPRHLLVYKSEVDTDS